MKGSTPCTEYWINPIWFNPSSRNWRAVDSISGEMWLVQVSEQRSKNASLQSLRRAGTEQTLLLDAFHSAPPPQVRIKVRNILYHKWSVTQVTCRLIQNSDSSLTELGFEWDLNGYLNGFTRPENSKLDLRHLTRFPETWYLHFCKHCLRISFQRLGTRFWFKHHRLLTVKTQVDLISHLRLNSQRAETLDQTMT